MKRVLQAIIILVLTDWACTTTAATLHAINSANINIPDYPAAGANSSITLSGAPAGSTITSVSLYYEIRHTYIGDLQVWLTAFYGGVWHDYLLRNQVGGSADDIIEFRGPLGFWNGASPNQTWYLVVKDLESGDIGYIDFFEIWVDYSTPQPDLTRGTDNLSNLSPRFGDVVTASITIRNPSCGTANAGASHVGFYWSTSPSFPAGSLFYEAPVAGVAANGSVPLNQGITINSPPGTYYLGYRIDNRNAVVECNENNNGIYYWTVTVLPPAQPDLTKSTDNLSNVSPRPGELITASLTILNQSCLGGSLTTGPFHVGFYWSTDPTFSGVLPFYEAPLGGCPANGTVSHNQGITISAATTPGTYYLGYRIDSRNAVGECNENNNGIYYWTVTVVPPALPDFVVTSVTFTPAVPQCGQSFSASVTVRNQGTTAGNGGWLDVWVNQPLNQACGADGNTWTSVGALAVSESRTFTFTGLTAPPTGVPWIFRTFVDSACQTAESNEGNNQTTTSYGQCGSLPDFAITSISLSPSSPQPGQAFTAIVTVRNQSALAADGGWLDLWAHQPSAPACETDGNTWAPAGSFAPSQTKTFTLNLTAPTAAGSYTFRAFVDSYCDTAEGNEGNNQSTISYTVPQPTQQPDFVITAVNLTPASPQPGQTFTASVTVQNQGAASGDGGWLDVWAHQPSAAACGTDGNTWASVGILSANQTRTFTLNLTAPASAGSYTLRAFVDSYCQTPESNEANQTQLAYSVTTAGQPPDFLVTSITFNPPQPIGGQPFTAFVTVKNQGGGAGDGKWLDVWLNEPSAQPCEADGDQYQSVGTLSVNQSRTMTFNLTAPPSGAPWTLRAFVDSGCQSPESNDGNNQLSVTYGVNPISRPDFIITSINITPEHVSPGASFTAYVTVRNQGAGSGDGGWLDVWADNSSPAGCGDSGDTFATVGMIAPGESRIITVANLEAGPAGPNTLRAFVDSGCQTAESNDANNQSTLNYDTSPRVLLLLHGMNTGPETWNRFVLNNFNNSAPIIRGGHNGDGDSPLPDAHGVVCYRVDFGFYDASSGRLGVEGISASGDENGDFSTFNTLGREVWEAVNYILTVHPNARISLLGHSRGGLAARAFLQESVSSSEKSSIVAFLSTGTPHKGSRLGRIYPYLNSHPRATAQGNYWEDDWEVVDTVGPHLDVRRPTVEDLSDVSAPLSALNTAIGNLPSAVTYGALAYTGVNLGRIARNVFLGFDYSIFASDNQTTGIGPQVSTQAEDYMLGAGLDPLTYPGDGIVPRTSQRFDDISGFPASTFHIFLHSSDILHTEEPEQDMHLTDALNSVLDWWQ